MSSHARCLIKKMRRLYDAVLWFLLLPGNLISDRLGVTEDNDRDLVHMLVQLAVLDRDLRDRPRDLDLNPADLRSWPLVWPADSPLAGNSLQRPHKPAHAEFEFCVLQRLKPPPLLCVINP